MWDLNQPYFDGRLIPPDQAWRRFDDWMAGGKQIGVWFVSKSGSVRTAGTMESARNGRVEFRNQSALAAFNLQDAQYTYGPFRVFPRWPMGPTVELMALQAFFKNGDWLVLAEGLMPEGVAPRALPA
jgi:hypothetical protein